MPLTSVAIELAPCHLLAPGYLFRGILCQAIVATIIIRKLTIIGSIAILRLPTEDDMLTKRVEILLEPAEMQALLRQAKKAKKSVGALIRDAVKEKYLTPSRQDRHTAVKRLLSSECQIKLPPWKQIKKDLQDSMVRRRAID
jgi:hypothetical protein